MSRHRVFIPHDIEWEFKRATEGFPPAASLDRQQKARSCRSKVNVVTAVCVSAVAVKSQSQRHRL